MSQAHPSDDADLHPRLPIWLTAEHRADLHAQITELLSDDLHPRSRQHLTAVLEELGVAVARDAVWPTKTALIRQATGMTGDTLPVRMSDEEAAVCLTLPGLSDSTRRALDDGTATPLP